MRIEKKAFDLTEFLHDEYHDARYVCFSDFLDRNHPEFIITIDFSQVEDIETLNKRLLPESRIIIRQSKTLNPELVYQIFLKKTTKTDINMLNDKIIEQIANNLLKGNDEDDYYDDDNEQYINIEYSTLQ